MCYSRNPETRPADRDTRLNYRLSFLAAATESLETCEVLKPPHFEVYLSTLPSISLSSPPRNVTRAFFALLFGYSTTTTLSNGSSTAHQVLHRPRVRVGQCTLDRPSCNQYICPFFKFKINKTINLSCFAITQIAQHGFFNVCSSFVRFDEYIKPCWQ